jgi:hypothetical protein
MILPVADRSSVGQTADLLSWTNARRGSRRCVRSVDRAVGTTEVAASIVSRRRMRSSPDCRRPWPTGRRHPKPPQLPDEPAEQGARRNPSAGPGRQSPDPHGRIPGGAAQNPRQEQQPGCRRLIEGHRPSQRRGIPRGEVIGGRESEARPHASSVSFPDYDSSRVRTRQGFDQTRKGQIKRLIGRRCHSDGRRRSTRA